MKKGNLLSVFIFIGCTVLTLSCSQKKGIGSIIEDAEMQLIKTKQALMELGIKSEAYVKLIYRVDSLTSLLDNAKPHITNNWFRGMDKPYEDILRDLAREGYDITNFQNGVFEPKPKGLLIILKNNWNSEEVNKLKAVILKTLPSEPSVGQDSVLKWTTPEYDCSIGRSITDNEAKIGLVFMLSDTL